MVARMADIKDAVSRSKNMSAIRSRDTKPEMFIRKALYADGFRYRIAPSNIPGHPDLYVPKYRVAVFVHGCFWHRHPGCRYAYIPKSRTEFWETKFRNNVRRDEEVRAMLEAEDIRILIIWECVIKAIQKKSGDVPGFIRHIEEFIRSDAMRLEVEADENVKTWRDSFDCH